MTLVRERFCQRDETQSEQHRCEHAEHQSFRHASISCRVASIDELVQYTSSVVKLPPIATDRYSAPTNVRSVSPSGWYSCQEITSATYWHCRNWGEMWNVARLKQSRRL